MIARFTLPTDQAWIIDRILKLGYRINDGGLCYGISIQAEPFLLFEKANQLDDLLKKIHATSVDNFATKYAWPTDPKHPETSSVLAVRAFLDAAVLTQFYYYYSEIFENPPAHQNAPETQLITAPVGFPDTITPVKSFCSVYTFAELQTFLSGLSQSPVPFSSLICNTDHAILISYSPTQKTWFFLDPNFMPVYRSQEIEPLINYIFEAFEDENEDENENNMLALSHQISTASQHQKKMQSFLEEKTQEVSWQEVHVITQEKIARKENGKNWLEIVCMTGQVDVVQKIIELNPTLLNQRINPPLLTAIYYNQTDVIKLLIKLGANINQSEFNSPYQTPFLKACEKGKLRLLKLLVTRGATCQGKEIEIAFINTVRKGSLSTAKYILSFIPKNKKAEMEKTIVTAGLLVAASIGDLRMVKWLIDKGGDINALDGGTPLTLAAEYLFLETEMLEFLLSFNPEIDKKNEQGKTPLYCLIEKKKSEEQIDLLLQRGANLYTANKYGMTPLALAIIQSSYNVILCLLKHEAKTNPSPIDDSFLKLAEERGDKRILRLVKNACELKKEISFVKTKDSVFLMNLYEAGLKSTCQPQLAAKIKKMIRRAPEAAEQRLFKPAPMPTIPARKPVQSHTIKND